MDAAGAEQSYDQRRLRLLSQQDDLRAKLYAAQTERDVRAQQEESDTVPTGPRVRSVFELDISILQISQALAGVQAQLQLGGFQEGERLRGQRLVPDEPGYLRLESAPDQASDTQAEPGWWKRTWRDHTTSLLIGIVLVALGIPAATFAAIWAANITGN